MSEPTKSPTSRELTAWAAAIDRATEGPWRVCRGARVGLLRIVAPTDVGVSAVADVQRSPREDADFIALARHAMPRLIAEVRRLRAGGKS